MAFVSGLGTWGPSLWYKNLYPNSYQMPQPKRVRLFTAIHSQIGLDGDDCSAKRACVSELLDLISLEDIRSHGIGNFETVDGFTEALIGTDLTSSEVSLPVVDVPRETGRTFGGNMKGRVEAIINAFCTLSSTG
jgi:hypothetical protein